MLNNKSINLAVIIAIATLGIFENDAFATRGSQISSQNLSRTAARPSSGATRRTPRAQPVVRAGDPVASAWEMRVLRDLNSGLCHKEAAVYLPSREIRRNSRPTVTIDGASANIGLDRQLQRRITALGTANPCESISNVRTFSATNTACTRVASAALTVECPADLAAGQSAVVADSENPNGQEVQQTVPEAAPVVVVEEPTAVSAADEALAAELATARAEAEQLRLEVAALRAPAPTTSSSPTPAPAHEAAHTITRDVGNNVGASNRENADELNRAVSTCLRASSDESDLLTAETLLARYAALLGAHGSGVTEQKIENMRYNLRARQLLEITKRMRNAGTDDLSALADEIIAFAQEHEDDFMDSDKLSNKLRTALIDIAQKIAQPTRRNEEADMGRAIEILTEGGDYVSNHEDAVALETGRLRLQMASTQTACTPGTRPEFISMECNRSINGLTNSIFQQMVGASNRGDVEGYQTYSDALIQVVGRGGEDQGMIGTIRTQHQDAAQRQTAWNTQLAQAQAQIRGTNQVAAGGRMNESTAVQALGATTAITINPIL